MLSSIQTRIESIATPKFNLVESGFNLSLIKGRSIPKSYCAYVVPVSEKPLSVQHDSLGAVQEVQSTIGIVLGLQNRNDPTGKKGNIILAQARDAIKSRLLGWSPKVDHSALIFTNSNLLAMSDNGIWWMEQFSTRYYLQSPLQV